VRAFLPALGASLLLAGCAAGDDDAQTRARVAGVGDGDTIALTDGRRVRLVQIDAPEERGRECFAAEATAALEDLLPRGARVRLEADDALDDVDRFGRLLRYVHRRSLNVNLALVERGAAAAWFFDGARGRYADELLAATRRARAERRGLWRACPAARLEPELALETG
jgi:micrococcal nuclease